MTCEELQPDYLLYATGTMGEPESSELRAHLERGCAACIEGLRQAHALAYSLGASVEGPDPPRALRGRVLGISTPEKRRPARWYGWAALAAAAIVCALIPGFLFYRELSESRAQQAATAARLSEEQVTSASLREAAAAIRNDTSRAAVPIFALELERGGSAETLKQLAIPPGGHAVVLALPADLVRQASAAELHNAAGQTIWSASPLPSSDADSTGLTIPAQLLSPGRYEVVLMAGNRRLARMPFQATLRKTN